MRCVYFIESAGLIKVGLTSDLKRRMLGLAAFSPTPIMLVGYIERKQAALGAEESKAHKRFRSSRDHGEWFKISVGQAEAYVTSAGGTVTSEVPTDSEPDIPIPCTPMDLRVPEGKKLFTCTETAEILQLSPETVRRWVRKGVIRHVKVGPFNTARIEADEIRGVCLSSHGVHTHGTTMHK